VWADHTGSGRQVRVSDFTLREIEDTSREDLICLVFGKACLGCRVEHKL
jgi:hypothetical protein